MTIIAFIDSPSLIHAANVGLGSWTQGQPVPPDATRFLEELFGGSGRKVINELVLREITAGSHKDGGLLEDWVRGKLATGQIELDPLTPAELQHYENIPNGGERSLIEATAEKPAYHAPVENRRFVSDENFTNKPFFKDKGYTDENWRSNPGVYEERYQASGADADFQAGEEYVRAARKIGLHENEIFGRPLSGPSLGDTFRALMHDESGAATLPGGRHWNELSDYVRNNKLLLAGEAVGVAAIVLDAAATRQAFAGALARGDLDAANELLGGLIGRSFGGAFAAAVAGAAGGSIFGPPGAVLGAILGGIVGAIGGSEIGSWLFGALNDMGLSLASFIDALSDLLRDILSDPLVLDLDGDGIELMPLASSVTMFDLDGDGALERTGWVAPHDGLLVHDANGNGSVDGVGELFGSASVDGYDELETLDANDDGRIDSLDPAFADLLVWRDLNLDGVSTPDELLTLAQVGITRFNLGYTQPNTDVDGNIIARAGTYVRSDGTSRVMASVQFALDESINRPEIPENADLGNLHVLPNLPASAALGDLRTAMFFDPVLKTMVEDLVYGQHEFGRFKQFADGGFVDLLYRWTGVDTSVPEDPDAPYYHQVFEALTGQPLVDLGPHAREQLEELWPELVKQLGDQFLFQAAQNPSLEPLFNLLQEIAALDPSSLGYLDDVTELTDAAVAETLTVVPAYDYLELFTGITVDPSNGVLSGDYDAFVAISGVYRISP